jgi:LuxR family transcriptional regulator, maltose regulon positive regulatory protein
MLTRESTRLSSSVPEVRITLDDDGSDPVISTKLSPPPLPRAYVPRPRLHALLDAGVEGPMTLISGLAGSGKTTLLASWIATRPKGLSAAWVTVESRDRDAPRFWAHVLAAIGSTPAGRTGPLTKLTPPRTAGDEGFLSRFIEAVGRLTRPLVLVIDDEQASGSREIDRVIERLAWLAPGPFRLVLATRRNPRMPLARLRAGGKMTQIRGGDLGFTVDEAKQLLRGFGVRLSEGGVEALVGHTEGWAVALRFAAEALPECPDREAFAREFAGNDRSVSEYLWEELLSRVPPELQLFLLRTSIADRLTLELAEQLTGTEAQTHLAALRRESSLVASLGGGWFRYNRLVTELLRARLTESEPGEASELHATAATWLAARGFAREALEHALAAGNSPLAAEVLSEMEIWPVLAPGGAALRKVIDRLPRGELAGYPDSLVAVAASRVVEGDTEEALGLLRSWQRSSRAPHAPPQRIRAAIVGLAAARRSGDVAATLRWSRRAVRQGDVDISEVEADRLRALLLEHRGWAMLSSGAREQARLDLSEGHRAARWIGDDALHLSCHSLLAACELGAGHVSAAADLANEALAFASERGMVTAVEVAMACFVLAAVHAERGELDALETLLESGRGAARGGNARDGSMWAMEARLRARVNRWRENPDVAANLLSATGRRLERDPDLRELSRSLAVEEAEMCLAAGRPEAAMQLLAKGEQAGEGLREAVVRARSASLQGKPDEAAAGLDRALESIAHEDVSALTAAWLLRAAMYWDQSDPTRAWEAMEHALLASEPDGIAYPFLFEDQSRELLWSHIGRGTGYEEWALTLLDRIESRRPAAGGATPTESLSARERTVLQYMDTLMSVNEISRELYVSTNTVKTHIKHIYRKLGVSRRRDAVERARALHLLDGHPTPSGIPAGTQRVAASAAAGD